MRTSGNWDSSCQRTDCSARVPRALPVPLCVAPGNSHGEAAGLRDCTVGDVLRRQGAPSCRFATPTFGQRRGYPAKLGTPCATSSISGPSQIPGGYEKRLVPLCPLSHWRQASSGTTRCPAPPGNISMIVGPLIRLCRRRPCWHFP